MQPYIIFSLARTGSTTLLRLLNCRQGLRCVFEPFNTRNADPRLSQCNSMRRQHGLEHTVQWLWTMCNGFKHVWRWDGWPFLDDPDLNRRVLVGLGAKIILLQRRNRLRRAISVQISEQMQLWTPNTAEEFRRIPEHRFQALDLSRLREEIDGAASALDWARRELTAAGGTWREVAYEDLFEAGAPVEPRLQAVQSLLEFLEVGRATERELLAMRTIVNPAVTGFQNAEAYRKIPNMDEVERTLGCAETGFVYDR
jgi:LPS sulfotransferase NodH